MTGVDPEGGENQAELAGVKVGKLIPLATRSDVIVCSNLANGAACVLHTSQATRQPGRAHRDGNLELRK